jgi:hypothetical protein
VRFVFTFPDRAMGELIRKSDSSVATQQNFCWERKRAARPERLLVQGRAKAMLSSYSHFWKGMHWGAEVT